MTSFTTGMQALQSQIEANRQKASAGSGVSAKGLTYLSWKPGEKKIVRFLTDELLTGEFYDFIITKTGKTANFLINPEDKECLQLYMSPAPGLGWRKTPSGPIEEPNPVELVVGMAVLREEVPGPDRKLVLQDYREDRDVNGTPLPSRVFGIIQQRLSNFWTPLVNGCFDRFGTICDRDYEIRREGTTRDTKYTVIPLPEDPALSDPDVVKTTYGYGAPWNDADPNRFLMCPTTVIDWARYFCGEERYKFHLAADGSTPAQPSGIGEFHPATTHNPDEAQVVAPATRFMSIQETLLSKQANQPSS